jgi:hypothetical protein
VWEARATDSFPVTATRPVPVAMAGAARDGVLRVRGSGVGMLVDVTGSPAVAGCWGVSPEVAVGAVRRTARLLGEQPRRRRTRVSSSGHDLWLIRTRIESS